MAAYAICDECDREYRLADSMAGKIIRCKECGAEVDVPLRSGGGSGRASRPQAAAPQRRRDRNPPRARRSERSRDRERGRSRRSNNEGMSYIQMRLIGAGIGAIIAIVCSIFGIGKFGNRGRDQADAAPTEQQQIAEAEAKFRESNRQLNEELREASRQTAAQMAAQQQRMDDEIDRMMRDSESDLNPAMPSMPSGSSSFPSAGAGGSRFPSAGGGSRFPSAGGAGAFDSGAGSSASDPGMSPGFPPSSRSGARRGFGGGGRAFPGGGSSVSRYPGAGSPAGGYPGAGGSGLSGYPGASRPGGMPSGGAGSPAGTDKSKRVVRNYEKFGKQITRTPSFKLSFASKITSFESAADASIFVVGGDTMRIFRDRKWQSVETGAKITEQPHVVDISADGTQAILATGVGTQQLARLDTESGEIKVLVQARMVSAKMSSDGTRVVALDNLGRANVYQLKKLQPTSSNLGTVLTPRTRTAISTDGRTMIVVSGPKVHLVGSQSSTATLPVTSTSLAIAADAQRILVAEPTALKLFDISGRTVASLADVNSPTGTVPSLAQPDVQLNKNATGFCLQSDGQAIVGTIEGSQMELKGALPVEGTPRFSRFTSGDRVAVLVQEADSQSSFHVATFDTSGK